MGALFSKSSKTQTPKDPKWQGIGNTPLPSSSQQQQQQQQNQARSHTLNNANNSTKATAGKANKSSKIMLLLKLDPKAGRGQRKVISKNLISLPSDFRVRNLSFVRSFVRSFALSALTEGWSSFSKEQGWF